MWIIFGKENFWLKFYTLKIKYFLVLSCNLEASIDKKIVLKGLNFQSSSCPEFNYFNSLSILIDWKYRNKSFLVPRPNQAYFPIILHYSDFYFILIIGNKNIPMVFILIPVSSVFITVCISFFKRLFLIKLIRLSQHIKPFFTLTQITSALMSHSTIIRF